MLCPFNRRELSEAQREHYYNGKYSITRMRSLVLQGSEPLDLELSEHLLHARLCAGHWGDSCDHNRLTNMKVSEKGSEAG